MSLEECINITKSSVVKISLIAYGGLELGSGTGFITDKGIVTNSHVIRKGAPEAISVSSDFFQEFRVPFEESIILCESSPNESDFALLNINELEMQNCIKLHLSENNNIELGQQVAFLGYPFGMNHSIAVAF